MDEKFKHLILEFVQVLNESGFSISIDKILKIFDIYGVFNFYNEKEMRMCLKTLLCSDYAQYEAFDQIFYKFFKGNKTIHNDIDNLEKYMECVQSIQNETFDLQDGLNIACLAAMQSVIQSEIMEDILKMDYVVITDACFNKEIGIKKIEDALEEILLANIESKNDDAVNEYILKVIEMMKKIKKKDFVSSMKNVSDFVRDIEKYSSISHRDTYIEGRNAVRALNGFLYKDMTRLDYSDMEELRRYIAQNAAKFKTKLERNIAAASKNIFDYRRVIKHSIKTDGVPMELFYKKPKKFKVKIICITDISGSCKKAAQVLLSFVYALQEVFPGGCESYVFVKQLKEATDIFKNYSFQEANERASVLVERNYSDYYTAFKEFDENYFSRITKDSIVIYLGDARNNNNHSGVEYIKRIRNKILSGKGKMYWLNPDNPYKWGQGDSIIATYSKLMDGTIPVKVPQDIINFLNNIKV